MANEQYTSPNMSRSEEIVQATIDGTEYNKPSQSRLETLLIELKEAFEAGGGESSDYATALSLTIDSNTYIITARLLNKDGDTLGTTQTVNLPLESVVVSGYYNSYTQTIVLTLQSGSTIEFSVADLVSGLQSEITSTNKLNADLVDDSTSTNKFVTSAEKTAWNSKSDFSGNYNDLTNKPTIPSSAADVNALPASTLYAGASTAGGAATSANKINTDAGSATQPVYFDNGVPVATTYSLAKSVPADAVFTDTTYESKVAASGGTDVSLCTTGEKYIWNNKSDFSGDYNDLNNKPTIPVAVTVDQTYDSTSTNPQSGTAVADAIVKKPGEITTGKQYAIDGQTVTAGTGAEAFNDLTNNKASGQYSHAEGYYTTAYGGFSHAEGYYTEADHYYSHAEGYYTTAAARYSHAEGNHTTASGVQSHAEGGNTRAYSANSHAEGYSTKASSDYQHVQGKFNVEDANDTYAFIIGNGTADDARHNAFAIDWNGLIYVNGAATGVDVSALATAVSAKIGATDYATQTTGGTVKVWTTTESGETTLHISTQ